MYCKSAHRVHAKYMLSTLAVRAEYTRSTYRVHELYSVTTLRPRLRRRRRLRLRRLIRPRLLRLLILPIDTGLEHFRNHFSSFFSLSSLATLALLVSCGWERGRVLGKCATYELSTTCYTCLRQRGAPPTVGSPPHHWPAALHAQHLGVSYSLNAGPRLRRDGREGVEGVLPRNYLLRAILACFRGGHQRAIFTTFFGGSLLIIILTSLLHCSHIAAPFLRLHLYNANICEGTVS